MLGWTSQSAVDDVVVNLNEMEDLQRCVHSVLLFWVHVLAGDFGVLPTPFYPSPRSFDDGDGSAPTVAKYFGHK